MPKYDKRPSQRKTWVIQDVDINITGVLNLFLILIPYLLLIVTFVKMGMIDSSLTQISRGESEKKVEEAKKQEKIHLTLAVHDGGFTLGSAEKILSREVVVSSTTALNRMDIRKKSNGEFDYDTLTKVLQGIKEKFPHEDTMIITAADDIRYDTIIAAMDASRFTYLVDTAGQKRKYVMFPNVVIASRSITGGRVP